jgi:hypothetical protein
MRSVGIDIVRHVENCVARDGTAYVYETIQCESFGLVGPSHSLPALASHKAGVRAAPR